ncbi:MAG: DUF190 domain-containing protein [Thermodesulfobacteriota bacterium]
MKAKRMNVVVSQTDQWRHRPLYLAILERLKAAGCAGAVVTNAIAGFGPTSQIKTHTLLELSIGLPVMITVVDRPEQIERVLPEVTRMLSGGVITVEDVDVAYYSAAFDGGVPDLRVSNAMSAHPEAVIPDTPIADVVERLVHRDYTELPVVDVAGKLIGAIGDTEISVGPDGISLSLQKAVGPDLVREHLARIKAEGAKVQSLMRSKVLSVRPEASLREAAFLMHQNDVRRLFVVDADGRLVGVISRLDIFECILSGYRGRTAPQEHRLPLEHRTVAEIMDQSFPTVSEDTPLLQAAEAVAASEVKRALVVDDRGNLVGIIADSDIVHRVDAAEKPGFLTLLRSRWSERARQEVRRAHGQSAADVMTSPVVTVRDTSPVIDALSLSVEQHIKRLPVLDANGKVVGIVSRPALLAASLEAASTRSL